MLTAIFPLHFWYRMCNSVMEAEGSSPSSCLQGSAARLYPGACFQPEVSVREGWEPAGDDASGEAGGVEVAQDGCGAEGGAHGNRKHRPLSVSPRLELAPLKVYFRFQNETSLAGSEPLVPWGVPSAARRGCMCTTERGSWCFLADKPLLVAERVCLLCLSFPSGGAELRFCSCSGGGCWAVSLQLRVLQWVFKPVFKQEESQAEELGLPGFGYGENPFASG